MFEETPRYTIILHRTRKELKLSCNEFCVADTIYHLSSNPENRMSGWCYMGKEKMAKFLNLSKPTIHNIINRLLEKKVIYRDINTRYLKVTSKWFEFVITEKNKIKEGKKSLPGVKPSFIGQAKNTSYRRKETIRNNNNDKDSDTEAPWKRNL